MSRGRVFEIQHLAVYDGPGIRTVIYLKGCPLRCLWCHNPEGLIASPQVFYNAERCVSCGRCASACTNGAQTLDGGIHAYLRSKCQSCGRCAAYCESHAIENVGYSVEANEIFREILSDRPFFGEDGGLTLSGGEPLAQPDFAYELLSLAKEAGISTCVETSGYCAAEVIERISAVTDLFLFDVKETDEALHRRFTGVSNQRILANLALLDRLGASVIVRAPIIPELNMRDGHFKALAELAQKFDAVQAIELEPYHPIGLAKYEALDMKANYENSKFLESDRLAEAVKLMSGITEKPIRLSTGVELQ